MPPYPKLTSQQAPGAVSPRLVGVYQQEEPDGNTYRFGGLVTYEKPIREFGPDIQIVPGSNRVLRPGQELPTNCVGLRFLNVVAGCAVSINGGGYRTVLNGDVISGAEIALLQVVTDSVGSLTVQAVGTGD